MLFYLHIIIVRISPFCLHHQQKSFIIITITYSRRGSVWSYEHRRCARESTSTSRSGRPQSSPTGRKPWGSTLSDLWQYFDKIPLGGKYLKYWLQYLLWFAVGNFEVEGESCYKHVSLQPHLEELLQSFIKVHLIASCRFEHCHYMEITTT